MINISRPRLCGKIGNYSGKIAPVKSGKTLEISSHIDLLDINDINENKFYFSISIHLHLSWIDYQLGITGTETKNNATGGATDNNRK